MSEVPKHWAEFMAKVDGYIEEADAIVEAEEVRRKAEYDKLPWHKKLFKAGPGTMTWEFDLIAYSMRNFPKYTEGTIEEYYSWLIETGKE